jgi:hypothetical protein
VRRVREVISGTRGRLRSRELKQESQWLRLRFNTAGPNDRSGLDLRVPAARHDGGANEYSLFRSRRRCCCGRITLLSEPAHLARQRARSAMRWLARVAGQRSSPLCHSDFCLSPRCWWRRICSSTCSTTTWLRANDRRARLTPEIIGARRLTPHSQRSANSHT